MANILVKVKINSTVEGVTLRVLAVTPSYPRFEGDYQGRFIQDLYSRLAKHIDIRVLTPRCRSSTYIREPGVTKYPYMPLKCLEFISDRTMKEAPLSHISQLPAYMASAYMHMHRIQADVIHAHWTIPMGYLASYNLRNPPLILTCHGSDCTLPLTNPIYRPFTKRALKKADKIVAVSEYVKKLALKLGASPEKVSVNYLGVDTEKFRPAENRKKLREDYNIPPENIVVGSLGRLVPSKRVHDLIGAASINNKKLDATYLIGGDGPESRYLKNLVKRLGLENVHFTGFVKDTVCFHQVCDLYVLASEREGLSVSLQEAMACGCIPVAVNGVGCPEVIDDEKNGFLYTIGSIDELAQRIIKASEFKQAAEARKIILDKFDLSKNALKYLKIYSEMLTK